MYHVLNHYRQCMQINVIIGFVSFIVTEVPLSIYLIWTEPVLHMHTHSFIFVSKLVKIKACGSTNKNRVSDLISILNSRLYLGDGLGLGLTPTSTFPLWIFFQIWTETTTESVCLSLLAGMSHEPKSPALGMISTAPCTMATVSPLTPSPISGALIANGSPASQSGHSGFAAALRKLAKQAEEPRGECALSSRLYPSIITLFSLSSQPWCHAEKAVVSKPLLGCYRLFLPMFMSQNGLNQHPQLQ